MTDTSSAVRAPLAILLCGVAACVVAGWLALAVIHLDDDYRVTHTQGVWIAAADAARAGMLYPPLFDGAHYAGTRYMPLPLLLNAFGANVVDDPLAGGKLVAAVLMSALLALVFVVARQYSAPWPLAAALAAVVLATETGLQAGTTIGGDLLPVVLQVAAIAVVLGGGALAGGGWAAAGAGVLCDLAAASKLTAFWGGLAILTWLVGMARWTSARTFAMSAAATAAAVLGAVQIVTGGGLAEHLSAFSLAGVQGASGVVRAPNQVLFNLKGYASGAVVLLPFAALGVVMARSWRRLALVHIALAYATIALLVAYTDVGTGFNQLLDVVVLTALATGYLAGEAVRERSADTRTLAVMTVAIAVLWASGLDLVRTVFYDVRTTVSLASEGVGERPARIVARMIAPNEEILAEDPSIAVELGQRPVIMDPFMLARLDRADPQRVDPLVGWINDRRFGLVVLVVPLEKRDLDFWWSDFHFGPRVANALRESYRPAGTAGPYFLYRPSHDVQQPS